MASRTRARGFFCLRAIHRQRNFENSQTFVECKLKEKPQAKDVQGIRKLALRVECGPDDDALDRAAWGDAMLIR